MQRHLASAIAPIVILVLCPSWARAQEAGKTGVTFGYPAAVGILWHATENVAIRPELSFAFTSTDGTAIEASSDALALGVSALFYVKRWDAASAYWSPRFAWSRTSTTSEATFPGSSESEITGNTLLYSGSFGAQAWIGRRFSAFGEVGLAYSRGTTTSSSTGFETTNRSIATRAGVGVVLYF